jgi:hypothetical protein
MRTAPIHAAIDAPAWRDREARQDMDMLAPYVVDRAARDNIPIAFKPSSALVRIGNAFKFGDV